MSAESNEIFNPDMTQAEDIYEEPEAIAEELDSDYDAGGLGHIMDVPLKVSVELGRGDITLRELLLIGQSTVIELDKLAGEPLEVLVNGRLVSKGEVVVVNDKYGIRLTDIIDPVANGKDSVQI